VTDAADDADGPPAGPVRLPLDGELDLHPFAPRDIPSVVQEYVRACRAGGVRHLRLAHGRGRGVQRAVVRRVLASMPEVLSYADAPPGAGGWGATVVELRPRKKR
jgi:DNA-nicking Smr family endonuclease